MTKHSFAPITATSLARTRSEGVFEKTWKGSDNVKKERFYLTDFEVLTVDASSATATYTYNWEGTMDGRSFRIQGREREC